MISITWEELEPGNISNICIIIDEDPKNQYPVIIPDANKRIRFIEEFEKHLKAVEATLQA